MAGSFANGTVLTVGSAVAELTSISGPSLSSDTIDVTTHDSADGFREYIGGLRDGGEISIDGNLVDPTESNLLISLLEAGTVTSGATIALPTSTAMTFTFDCIVTAYETKAPHDGKLNFTATLKVTGKPVLAATI
jgi:predicted secreted protein